MAYSKPGKAARNRKRSRIARTIIPLAIFGAMAVSNPGTGVIPAVTVGHLPTPASDSTLAPTMAEPVKVHFIDMGQGDSVYIQLPDHQDILIDAGDESQGSSVVDYLRGQGMDGELELLIATHPHRDHIGGIPEIMASFQVDEVIDSGLELDSGWYEAYVRSIMLERCSWVHDDHQTLRFGDTQLQILTGGEAWENVNDYSVVVRLICGEIEFLFPGDAEAAAEAHLPGDITSEILKVGHHGSETSTGDQLLARTKPELAVISVGTDNQYGHPDEETLARLQESGIEVYRTDQDGSVVITTDGVRYMVTGAR